MKLTYTQHGDYFIPNITVPSSKPLGKYGMMRPNYLRQHRPVLFNILVLEGTLYDHLAGIDQTAHERIERMVQELAKVEGITEALKAANQMEWVGRMNNISICFVRTESPAMFKLFCTHQSAMKWK